MINYPPYLTDQNRNKYNFFSVDLHFIDNPVQKTNRVLDKNIFYIKNEDNFIVDDLEENNPLCLERHWYIMPSLLKEGIWIGTTNG